MGLKMDITISKSTYANYFLAQIVPTNFTLPQINLFFVYNLTNVNLEWITVSNSTYYPASTTFHNVFSVDLGMI